MVNKQNKYILALALMLCCIWAVPFAKAQSLPVRFAASGDIRWSVAMEDEYFTRSGTAYHHDTALSSLGMALSAFRAKEGSLHQRGDNICAYLQSAGFQDIVLTQYDVEPTVRTIATAMAHKEIKVGEQSFQLLAVAVSGGGYQDEWKSNFSIGNSQHHEGFDQAAWQVVERIIRYTSAYQLQGAKVWIAGYSRAAATSNRTAAILLDKKLVDKENLFAYTFATPNNTKQKGAENYPSIFNVVGAFDPVPMVPFADWGFTRFGQTFFLPATEINSDYAKRVEPVKQVYYTMTGMDFWSNSSSNSALQKVLGAMAESVPDTKSYQNNMQNFMMNLWNNRSSPVKMLLSTAKEIYQAPDFRSSMRSFGDKMLSIFSNATQEKVMQETGILKDVWRNAGGLTDNLVHEHMPTVYLAWLSAYPTGEGLFTPAATYRQVRIDGMRRIKVLDEKGQVAASFTTMGAPTTVGEESSFTISLEGPEALYQSQGYLPLSLSGEELVITVPADIAYQVVVERDPEAFTNLSLRQGTAGRTRMQSYQAPMEKLKGDTTMTFDLPARKSWGTETYTLMGASGAVPFQQVAAETSLSNMEMNSGARSFLGQNIRTAIIILVAIALQAIFYLYLGGRALGAARRNRSLRKQGMAPCLAEPYRLLRNPGQKQVTRLKMLSLLLLLAGLIGIAAFVLMLFIWRTEFVALENTMVFWYATLYLLPFALVMLFSGLPIFAAGLHHLFWRGGTYRLKTARLLVLSGLAFTLLLIFLHITDLNNPVQPVILALLLLQVALLVISLCLSRACVKVETIRQEAKEGPHIGISR